MCHSPLCTGQCIKKEHSYTGMLFSQVIHFPKPKSASKKEREALISSFYQEKSLYEAHCTAAGRITGTRSRPVASLQASTLCNIYFAESSITMLRIKSSLSFYFGFLIPFYSLPHPGGSVKHFVFCLSAPFCRAPPRPAWLSPPRLRPLWGNSSTAPCPPYSAI